MTYLEEFLESKLLLQHEKDLLSNFLKENNLEDRLEKSISEWIDDNIVTERDLEELRSENSELEGELEDLRIEMRELKNKNDKSS